MEITLEIKSDAAFSIIEKLKSIKGVKIKNVEQLKENYLKDLSNAYQETELAEKGKLKLKRFDEILDDI